MSSHNNCHNVYVNPLLERYASAEMSFLFSPNFKFTTWRRLWIALAEAQQQLGLQVSKVQIHEMKKNIDTIDYDKVRAYERLTRHDVMAHIHHFGDLCPKAKPIIHLGATSAFVGDNTDLIQIRDAVQLTLVRLSSVISNLRVFALKHKARATLGFTHFQPAQLTTVGKRATLWMLELMMDFEALENYLGKLPFLGVKGTTGTQASFLKLFENNHAKVKKLDTLVAKSMGFDRVVPVAGQTYTRKLDAQVAAVLCGIAQSLHKFSNDIRLLQHLKEIEEPFEKGQVGSSAMAYKRNPMRSERITALSRYVMSISTSPAMTAAEQWFERTLDDSANKRLAIPEAFLCIDSALIIAANISDGLVVYPKVIERHIREELPFMATENILMEMVAKGGDRQELHEKIRVHSMEAGKCVKMLGKNNDLLDRIQKDPAFTLTNAEMNRILDIREFVGRAPEQTVEFIKGQIDPLLRRARKYGQSAVVELTV